jgi:uncharacterized membrane protein YeaQ/YmgE (transglycosylase-associated protein family)
MAFTANGLLVLLIIAGVCGVIARVIGGGTMGGFFVSIVVGLVGAFVGTFVVRTMHLPELYVITVDGHPFPIAWSIIGGAVSVALVKLIS